MSRWPLWLLHGLGAVAGWLAFALSGSYRRRLRAHTRQAGVPWSGAVASAGRMLLEIPWLWLRPRALPLGDWVRWDGAEKVDAALLAGRGVLILTPHLGCFEAAAQAYAERFGPRQPITVMFRPARKPWLRELVAASRDREHLAAAPAALAGIRQMLRALKKGEAVGVLPDQVPPEGMGQWQPFFGLPAYTMTLAARLIQQTGCTPILFFCERLSWGRGFVLHVRDFPMPPGEPDLAALTLATNQAMELLIREMPSQYLWGYNRYKAPRGAEVAA